MQKGNRTLTRAEKQDHTGLVKGYYSVKDPGGIFRLVSYEANPDTFQAQVLTNRPGDSNTTFPEAVPSLPVTASSTTAVPLGLVAEDLIVSTTSSPVETTTKDFVTITPTVVVEVEETTTVSPTTTDLPVEETTTSMTSTTTDEVVVIEEKIPPETTPPAPVNPETVVVTPIVPTIIIDSPQYWLEYEVLLNGGRSIYRSEGTRDDGNIIGSYVILLDGKPVSPPVIVNDKLRKTPPRKRSPRLVS